MTTTMPLARFSTHNITTASSPWTHYQAKDLRVVLSSIEPKPYFRIIMDGDSTSHIREMESVDLSESQRHRIKAYIAGQVAMNFKITPLTPTPAISKLGLATGSSRKFQLKFKDQNSRDAFNTLLCKYTPIREGNGESSTNTARTASIATTAITERTAVPFSKTNPTLPSADQSTSEWVRSQTQHQFPMLPMNEFRSPNQSSVALNPVASFHSPSIHPQQSYPLIQHPLLDGGQARLRSGRTVSLVPSLASSTLSYPGLIPSMGSTRGNLHHPQESVTELQTAVSHVGSAAGSIHTPTSGRTLVNSNCGANVCNNASIGNAVLADLVAYYRSMAEEALRDAGSPDISLSDDEILLVVKLVLRSQRFQEQWSHQ